MNSEQDPDGAEASSSSADSSLLTPPVPRISSQALEALVAFDELAASVRRKHLRPAAEREAIRREYSLEKSVSPEARRQDQDHEFRNKLFALVTWLVWVVVGSSVAALAVYLVSQWGNIEGSVLIA